MEDSVLKNDEIEIDLREICLVLLNKIVMIIMIGIIFGLSAYLTCKVLIKPVYESQTSLYILNKQSQQGTTSLSDLQSSTQITKDYMILVKSRTVTEKVISDLDLDMTNEELANSISVSTPTDTRVLRIIVSGKDQYQVKKIADKVAEVSASTICDIMQIEKVNVFERANVPDYPAKPNGVKIAGIAAILGIILSCAIVIIKYILNDTISSSDDIDKYLGISTLALIPLSEDLDDGEDTKSRKRKKKRSKKTTPYSKEER